MTIGKYKKMIIWVVAILILAVVINFAMQGNFSSKYDGFASCMTEKGVIMYGTDWCPNCQNQKQMFGKSFEKINYVNCDRAQKICTQMNIEGYPTWVIGEERLRGTQSLEKLASVSGCALE